MKKKIAEIVKGWIDASDYSQKDLAQKNDLTPASLCKFLSGDCDFPLPRFIQLVAILHPDQAEIDDAFAEYLDELNVPRGLLQLKLSGNQKGSLRARIHELVDQVPEEKLTVLEPVLKMMVEG